MIEYPCKECLVKACCKIKGKHYFRNCGCDPYELYRMWKIYSGFFGDKYAPSVMLSDGRARELGFTIPEDKLLLTAW